MAPNNDKGQLKRPRVRSTQPPNRSGRWLSVDWFLQPLPLTRFRFFQGSLPDDTTESKKPRRSDRLSSTLTDKTPVSRQQQLPSPVTRGDTHDPPDLEDDDSTTTPPGARTDVETPRQAEEHWSQNPALSSPPQDTQPLSQYHDRHAAVSDDVHDEAAEGVWGYLVPPDPRYGDKPIVLKKRNACPMPDSLRAASNGDAKNGSDATSPLGEEEAYEKQKAKGGVPSGGYLIGRHPECGMCYCVTKLCMK